MSIKLPPAVELYVKAENSGDVGSPVTLEFRFTLEDGKIASLEIGA